MRIRWYRQSWRQKQTDDNDVDYWKTKENEEGERDESGWIKAKCDRNPVVAADDGEVSVFVISFHLEKI